MKTNEAWKAVHEHAQRLKGVHLRELLSLDDRFATFSFSFEDLTVDLSKEKLDAGALDSLLDLARAAGVEQKRDAMFAGDDAFRHHRHPPRGTQRDVSFSLAYGPRAHRRRWRIARPGDDRRALQQPTLGRRPRREGDLEGRFRSRHYPPAPGTGPSHQRRRHVSHGSRPAAASGDFRFAGAGAGPAS